MVHHPRFPSLMSWPQSPCPSAVKSQAGEGAVGAEKAPGVSWQESQVPSTPHRHAARAWHHRWSSARRNTQSFQSSLSTNIFFSPAGSPGRQQHVSTTGWVPWGDHLSETEGSQSTNPGSEQSFGANEDKSAFSAFSPLTGTGLADDVQIFKMAMLSLKAQLKLSWWLGRCWVALLPGTQPEHMARRDLDFDLHLTKPQLK